MQDFDQDMQTDPARPPSYDDKLLHGPGIIVSRGLIYVTLLLMASALTWMALTRVDVVVDARGQLIVKDRPVQITPSESALVLEVPVKVGQHVSKGDLLLRLDAFGHTSEAQRVAADIEALRMEASRHRDKSEALAKLRTLLEQEQAAARRCVELIAEQLHRLEELEKSVAAAHAEVQAKRQEHLEAEGRIVRLAAEVERNRADAAEQLQLAAEIEARAQALNVRLNQLRELAHRCMIRAPISGKVTQLAIVHPGSVIDTTGPAVTIVPDDQPLLACVSIPNASMWRLRRGLGVSLEFDAFPREDYGLVQGTLLEIAPDAGSDGNYIAWVSIDPTCTSATTLIEQMKPGLMVNARILTEQRSVLDLLFRPLKRLSDETRVCG